MLCDFLPSTLLIYRQTELNVWVCSHYCSVLDSILVWDFLLLILRLFSHCTDHSNYTCVICHLVYIKSSSAAFQAPMLDCCSEVIVQRKFILDQKCWIPCSVCFLHAASSKFEKDDYLPHTCDLLQLFLRLWGGCRLQVIALLSL